MTTSRVADWLLVANSIFQNHHRKPYLLYLSKIQTLTFFSKKILSEKKEESKGEEDENSGEGIPTKAHLRFTMNEDPLFQYEDTRADSQASHFKMLMCKAEYIVELEIANMKSVLINVERSPAFFK